MAKGIDDNTVITELASFQEGMSEIPESERRSCGSLFQKETIIGGAPTQIDCLELNGQCYVLSTGWLKTVQLEDEWFEDVKDPPAVIAALKRSGVKADLFSFWQRLPETEPKYDYHQETVYLAALPVESYDSWWSQTIRSNIRTIIRKAFKSGIEVKEVPFDDEFVRGMVGIFNETPVRQGRPFIHYGKDFETVKQQFSRFIFREEMIGAYLGGELIGFIMLAVSDHYARTMQIISYQKHRNKNTNNALIAKAVEICAKKKLPYLVYEYWTDDSLSAFKHHCGFRQTGVPRYYVPLTVKGRLALAFGLHKGFKERVPKPVADRLKQVRKFWLQKKTGE